MNVGLFIVLFLLFAPSASTGMMAPDVLDNLGDTIEEICPAPKL